MVSKIVIDADLVLSPAFLQLTGAAPQVYLLFLRRRRMVKLGRKYNLGILNIATSHWSGIFSPSTLRIKN